MCSETREQGLGRPERSPRGPPAEALCTFSSACDLPSHVPTHPHPMPYSTCASAPPCHPRPPTTQSCAHIRRWKGGCPAGRPCQDRGLAALSYLGGSRDLGPALIALDTWHPSSGAEAGEAEALEIKVGGEDIRSDALVSSVLAEPLLAGPERHVSKDTCEHAREGCRGLGRGSSDKTQMPAGNVRGGLRAIYFRQRC